MPGKRPQSGLRLYARLLHEVSEINKGLPAHKQLSLQERREFISQKIYPLYKEVPGYKFRITQVRKKITGKLRRLPKRDQFDVTLIPEDLYDEIEYFHLDSLLGDQFKDWAVNVRVDAGNFGQTKIFNTRDYNYDTSGVSDITNAINTYLRNRPRKIRSGYFFYTGFIQVMPGRKNDSKPDSYFLDLVLQMGRTSVKKIEPIELPVEKTKDKKKRKLKRKKKAKETLQKRIKQIKFAKSKVKRIRQNVIREIKDFKNFAKKKYISAAQIKQVAKKVFAKEKAKLDKQLKGKNINQRRYDELISKMKKGYGQK